MLVSGRVDFSCSPREFFIEGFYQRYFSFRILHQFPCYPFWTRGFSTGKSGSHRAETNGQGGRGRARADSLGKVEAGLTGTGFAWSPNRTFFKINLFVVVLVRPGVGWRAVFFFGVYVVGGSYIDMNLEFPLSVGQGDEGAWREEAFEMRRNCV